MIGKCTSVRSVPFTTVAVWTRNISSPVAALATTELDGPTRCYIGVFSSFNRRSTSDLAKYGITENMQAINSPVAETDFSSPSHCWLCIHPSTGCTTSDVIWPGLKPKPRSVLYIGLEQFFFYAGWHDLLWRRADLHCSSVCLFFFFSFLRIWICHSNLYSLYALRKQKPELISRHDWRLWRLTCHGRQSFKKKLVACLLLVSRSSFNALWNAVKLNSKKKLYRSWSHEGSKNLSVNPWLMNWYRLLPMWRSCLYRLRINAIHGTALLKLQDFHYIV